MIVQYACLMLEQRLRHRYSILVRYGMLEVTSEWKEGGQWSRYGLDITGIRPTGWISEITPKTKWLLLVGQPKGSSDKQNKNKGPMMGYCLASVYDAGPTMAHHRTGPELPMSCRGIVSFPASAGQGSMHYHEAPPRCLYLPTVPFYVRGITSQKISWVFCVFESA